MKPFRMYRGKDVTGVSGTGHVLNGVVFGSGYTVVSWNSRTSSLGIYKNFYEFYQVHVRSHPENETVIEFEEQIKPTKREAKQKCRHCNNTYGDHPQDIQNIDEGYRRSCAGNLIELI